MSAAQADWDDQMGRRTPAASAASATPHQDALLAWIAERAKAFGITPEEYAAAIRESIEHAMGAA